MTKVSKYDFSNHVLHVDEQKDIAYWEDSKQDCLIFSMFPKHYKTVQSLRELEKENVVKIC